MYIIVRGECTMTLRGTDPITKAPVDVILGYLNTHSVVGCAEYVISN